MDIALNLRFSDADELRRVIEALSTVESPVGTPIDAVEPLVERAGLKQLANLAVAKDETSNPPTEEKIAAIFETDAAETKAVTAKSLREMLMGLCRFESPTPDKDLAPEQAEVRDELQSRFKAAMISRIGEIFESVGATSVSELPEDHYEEFYGRLQALVGQKTEVMNSISATIAKER